jgi:hypothetical protein
MRNFFCKELTFCVICFIINMVNLVTNSLMFINQKGEQRYEYIELYPDGMGPYKFLREF